MQNYKPNGLVFVLMLAAGSMTGCVAEVSGDPEENGSEGAADEPVDSDQLAASNSCLQIGRTYLGSNGRTIWGYGSVSCSGQSAKLTIRRSRWYGPQDMATVSVKNGQGDVYVGYDCAGTGTHDFYTRIWGYTIGGDYVYKDSNTIRVTCP